MFSDTRRHSVLEIGQLLTGRARGSKAISKTIEIGNKEQAKKDDVWKYILFIGVPAVAGIAKYISDNIDEASSFIDSVIETVKAPFAIFDGATSLFKNLFESFTDKEAKPDAKAVAKTVDTKLATASMPVSPTQAAASPNSVLATDRSTAIPAPFTPKSDAVTKDLLYSTARTQKVDKYLLQTIAQIESSMNPAAKNAVTGATGLYQFLPSTWNELVSKNYKDLGYTSSDINDSQKQAVVASRWFQDIGDLLQKTLGRPPSATEVYLVHFMGKSGGPRFIKALRDNPNAIAADSFQAAAKANPAIFYQDRGKGKAQTFQGVFDTLYNKVSPVYDAFAAEGGDAPKARPTTVAVTSASAAPLTTKASPAIVASPVHSAPQPDPSYQGETGRKFDKADVEATKAVSAQPEAEPVPKMAGTPNGSPTSITYFRDKAGRPVALQGS